MRTRTRITHNTIPAGSWIFARHDNIPAPPSLSNPVIESHVVNTLEWTSTASPDSSSEDITDEQPDHKRDGYCLHDVAKVQFFDLGSKPVLTQQLTGSPAQWHEVTVSGGYLAYTYARTHSSALFPEMDIESIDWSQMSYEAMEQMTPKFTKGNQFSNDIAELHQIKGLISPFGGAKSKIGKVSNATLWYEFGVAPTVSSINAVITLMRTVRKKVLDIINRGKRLQTRHYSRRVDIASEFPPAYDPSNGIPVYSENIGEYRAMLLRCSSLWVTQPQYHATMKFRYDVSRMSIIELELRAWSEAANLLDPLSILWNATPFSFVIDWFSNIGDWIDQFIHEDAIPIVIEDFSHSLKYSYITDMSIWWQAGLYEAPIARATVSHYERRREAPSLYSKITFRWPSFTALFLGAALGGQAYENRPRPPRIRRQLPYLRIRAGVFVS